MHARIQIYWCRSSIFRHLKLELLTQFPASNDETYINVVYIWRKFVSFYGYVHWRMTTEISVMYGSEKAKLTPFADLIMTKKSLWGDTDVHLRYLIFYLDLHNCTSNFKLWFAVAGSTLKALRCFLMNRGDQRVFFIFLKLSASFEYLCYGSTAIL